MNDAPLIQIGATKQAVDSSAAAITKIMDSAFKNHMDQSTVQTALMTFGDTTKVNNVSVTNSNFSKILNKGKK